MPRIWSSLAFKPLWIDNGYSYKAIRTGTERKKAKQSSRGQTTRLCPRIHRGGVWVKQERREERREEDCDLNIITGRKKGARPKKWPPWRVNRAWGWPGQRPASLARHHIAYITRARSKTESMPRTLAVPHALKQSHTSQIPERLTEWMRTGEMRRKICQDDRTRKLIYSVLNAGWWCWPWENRGVM